MKNVYIVRHGQCEGNAQDIIMGSRVDSPLTKLGRQQAAETGQKLGGEQIDVVVSSPLIRAATTARIICDHINYDYAKIKFIPLLKEYDCGGVSELHTPEAMHRILTGKATDAETFDQMLARIDTVLDELRRMPQQNILVVCHSGVMRMIKIALSDRRADRLFEIPSPSNGEIMKVEL